MMPILLKSPRIKGIYAFSFSLVLIPICAQASIVNNSINFPVNPKLTKRIVLEDTILTKLEVLKNCIFLSELQETNHLISGKSQLVIKSNNLFLGVSNLKCFGNPVKFYPLNVEVNGSHIVFNSYEYLDAKQVQVKFSYICRNCNSWDFEVVFNRLDPKEIISNKASIRKN